MESSPIVHAELHVLDGGGRSVLMDTLGVSIICRDEPIDRIAMLYEHLVPLVTEFSIVDTGSVDFDVDAPLIRMWDKVILNQFEWIDDFSAARNETLKYLSTDWVLHMDCDEMVSHDMYDSIERILDECNTQTKGWLFMTQNFWGGERGIRVEEHWHCRLFRRTSGKWYKPLHELVMLDGVQEQSTRGTVILPKANESAYLIHSKPRDVIEKSAALYNKIGAR